MFSLLDKTISGLKKTRKKINNTFSAISGKKFVAKCFDETIEMTVDWYKSLFYNEGIEEITLNQIEYYLSK